MSWTILLILLLYCILHWTLVTASVVCSVNFGGNGNVTSLDPDDRQERVSLISCSRGCCPDSSDGCCYRTTEDVIVYTVPVCIFLIVIIIVLICIFKRIRDNRRRLQDEQDKQAQDNPPSYSSCVVHPVSSSTTLNLVQTETTVEVVIHPPPTEEEENEGNVEGGSGGLVPPPPVYDDIFKRVEDDQIPVVSISGHVSFVDHTLIPAIKLSLSQNDLHSKMIEGLKQCRSSISLSPSYKLETETEKNPSDDAPVERRDGDTPDTVPQAVQNYENKAVFTIDGVDHNTSGKD